MRFDVYFLKFFRLKIFLFVFSMKLFYLLILQGYSNTSSEKYKEIYSDGTPRSNCSQMFFKIGVLKNFAILIF